MPSEFANFSRHMSEEFCSEAFTWLYIILWYNYLLVLIKNSNSADITSDSYVLVTMSLLLSATTKCSLSNAYSSSLTSCHNDSTVSVSYSLSLSYLEQCRTKCSTALYLCFYVWLCDYCVRWRPSSLRILQTTTHSQTYITRLSESAGHSTKVLYCFITERPVWTCRQS